MTDEVAPAPTGFDGWGVLELLGHRIRYGRISQVTAFGETFARIDMPTDPPTFELYSGKSIYGWRPATEEHVRKYHAPQPARLYLNPPIEDEELAARSDTADDDDKDDDVFACGHCGGDLDGTIVVHVAVEDGPAELWHKSCAEDETEQTASEPELAAAAEAPSSDFARAISSTVDGINAAPMDIPRRYREPTAAEPPIAGLTDPDDEVLF